MSGTSRNPRAKVLIFAAVVEVGTGLVLMINPVIVGTLLLGVDVSGVGILLGRCFGIALLSLGLACWPGQAVAPRFTPALRAMLTYNVLIALYLSYLGTAEQLGGVLLWPGVILHAVVALSLARAWCKVKRSEVANA